MCSETNNKLPCCDRAGAGSACDEEDALALITEQAANAMVKGTKNCSKTHKDSKQEKKDCIQALQNDFKQYTGKDINKEQQTELLQREAGNAVGDSVAACMANIADGSTLSEKSSARMQCRGGVEGKEALADALGKNASDISTTEVSMYANKGAGRAGTDKFKNDGDITLDAVKTAIAEVSGKKKRR